MPPCTHRPAICVSEFSRITGTVEVFQDLLELSCREMASIWRMHAYGRTHIRTVLGCRSWLPGNIVMLTSKNSDTMRQRSG